MGKFIVQRFVWMILVLFVVALTTFLLMHAVPGGPFSQDKQLPQQTIDQLNAKYNLDEPLHLQFIHYLTDILIPVVTTGEQPNSLDHEYLINTPLNTGDDATLR